MEPFYFKNLAYVQTKVDSDTLCKLKTESKLIFENQDKFKKVNNELAGNLEKEYLTNKSKEILKSHLVSLANEYYKHSQEIEVFPDWNIGDLWINFQKKYEHNPLHNHSGDLSFVIWIQIPYDLKKELSHPNCKNSNTPANSLFEFVFTDFLGRLATHRIEVDKSYEGTIIMFPSILNHTVHPFYTSDEYRISISGNLYMKKLKNTIVSYG